MFFSVGYSYFVYCFYTLLTYMYGLGFCSHASSAMQCFNYNVDVRAF